MTHPTPLQAHALAAARHGDLASARYVLRYVADRKRWCDETLRARWDGAATLLRWWHELDSTLRPPLDDLNAADAHAFLEHLQAQGLARSTMTGYRTGAAAMSCALRACRERPVTFEQGYAPFAGIFLPPLKRSSAGLEAIPDLQLDVIDSPLARVRLELLLALMALGMSLPEVCSRRWHEVNFKDRLLVGYRGRCLRFGVEVVAPLEALLALRPQRYDGQRVLGWQPETARRWLKQAQPDGTKELSPLRDEVTVGRAGRL